MLDSQKNESLDLVAQAAEHSNSVDRIQPAAVATGESDERVTLLEALMDLLTDCLRKVLQEVEMVVAAALKMRVSIEQVLLH